ncbi:unnamed protein product [Arabis nemorensis]|uniref:Uncharacterized protein n=1 Tax=Arabis nemorensis TaxID=586526 RepID=A0A565BJB8_9BRAS|nr:unnamed protein product [Arabis nemorensis]
MEDLREVTVQYMYCPNSTENAARRQRVMDGEGVDLMAKTAASIRSAASHQAGGSYSIPLPQNGLPSDLPQLARSSPTGLEPPEKKRRGRPF